MIDFSDEAGGKFKGDAKIRFTPWELFQRTDAVRLVERAADPEAAIRRAASRLGEGGYSLLSKNCEHFCTWVVRGTSSSKQAQAAVGFGTFVALGAFALMLWGGSPGQPRDSQGRFTRR